MLNLLKISILRQFMGWRSLTHFCKPLLCLWQGRSRTAFPLLFSVGLSLTLLMAACSPTTTSSSPSAAPSPSPTAATGQNQALRIGYQKAATILNVLKSQGTLEQNLQPEGVKVEWNEFAAGPQMLEALNVGSIDIAYTGETPPILAQAAGSPLRYIAYEPWGASGEAILVHKDSPINTVADLKGKKVALNKGSNVHYLLVRALESAGLQYSDVEVAFLPPSDARPAFEQKQVDAWAIWDPFLAAAEQATGARILADGNNLVENRGFYLSTATFTQDNPELIKKLLAELDKTSTWAKSNSGEVAKFLTKELKIDQSALEKAEKRRGYGIRSISDEVVAYQQQVADTFLKIKLIPKAIQVKAAVWQG